MRNKRLFWRLVIALTAAAGLAIRLYDLTDPPLDFHPARQFHSAIIARGYFEQMRPERSGYEHDRAILLGASEPLIEPPVMEWLAAQGYRLAGQDALWIPRLYAILFWMLGALPLYCLARRLSGRVGALAALAYYLFLPYAVIASRSFQPDPLMVCLILYAVWAFQRWLESPRWQRAVLAGALAGLAILIKQVAVFFLLGTFAGMLIAQWGPWWAVRSKQAWTIALLSAVPVLLYNIYGVWIDGFLLGQYSLRFFPQLWTDPAYYLNWIRQIDLSAGLPAFLLALCGWAFVLRRTLGWGLAGWLGGYLVYGFVFAHHISTHDYYQLPILPFVALGFAPLADLLWREANVLSYRRLSAVILSLLLVFTSVYAIYQARSTLKKADYRELPAVWQQISREVNYEPAAVIGLFEDYGAGMTYWGYFIPNLWPSTGDVRFREMAGQDISEGQIFEAQAAGRSFFIVTDLADFDRQTDLKRLLYDRYPLYAQGTGYLVFDLRHPLSASTGQE